MTPGRSGSAGRWGRPIRHGLTLASVVVVFMALPNMMASPWYGIDSHAYWSTDVDTLYARHLGGQVDAYLYPPPLAQALGPLTELPWAVFGTGWLVILAALLLALAGPLAGILVLTPPIVAELVGGNVNLVIAACVVVGFRWPAAWAFPILTKATPVVGLVWFAARREWRQLGIALGVTGAIAALSFAADPHLWSEWVGTLVANAATLPEGAWAAPLALRLPLAAVLVAFAALRGWRWVLPVGVLLSYGHLWPQSIVLLVACIPLVAKHYAQEVDRRPLRLDEPRVALGGGERGELRVGRLTERP